MSPDPKIDKNPEYGFLTESSLREPHILDIVREILLLQNQAVRDDSRPLATLDHLKKSRNIRIPYTTARDHQIEYLVDHLLKNYPGQMKTLTTFKFVVEEGSKKLDVVEIREYLIQPGEKDFAKLSASRDAVSLQNLLEFVSTYRLLNLSKLLKKTVNKNDLSRLIKLELGKSFFTFKNHSLDKNRVETAEDFCFHARNYDSVKNTLDLEKVKNIVKANSEPVLRRLKKYGILSGDFSDYRDSKLEYIFHILIDDLGPSLAEGDLIAVKNASALRNCLLKVDKILDPALTLAEDIVKHIRECTLCTEGDISALIPELTPDILKKWQTPETLRRNRIVTLSEADTTYLIDGAKYIDQITGLGQTLIYAPEKAASMPYLERQKAESNMEILVKAGRGLLAQKESSAELLGVEPEKLEAIRTIITDYENSKKQQSLKKEMGKIEVAERRKKRSIIQVILDFFSSLFGKGGGKTADGPAALAGKAKEMSAETRRLAERLVDRNAPLLALSDFVELTPENDALIDRMIDEMREHNVKIVVPIYSARKVLYPKRSQKVIIPDVEYLMVPPDTIASPEQVRTFTDSLTGYKLKDELVPGSAIMTIEKYLLTIYRQKRAQLLKREL